jgi:hypothetical protein
MAIKFFPSERKNEPGTGLDLVGWLRKGLPKKGNKPGAEVDYIRVEWNLENPIVARKHLQLQATWEQMYGPEPKLIPNVMFNRDSLGSVWTAWNRRWGSTSDGKPAIRYECDGETLSRWRGEDGKISREPRACLAPECGCSSEGMLLVWLPEFFKATGVLGEFAVTTHSRVDISEIEGTLRTAQSLATAAFGEPLLRGMAFNLQRVPTRITTPAGVTVTKYMVKLSIADGEAQRLAGEYQLMLPDPTEFTTLPALPAGPSTDENELTFEPRIYVWGPQPEEPRVKYTLKSDGVWFHTFDTSLLQSALGDRLDVSQLQTDAYNTLPLKALVGAVDVEDVIVTLRGVEKES